MTFLPDGDESNFRRPDFAPGSWVFLADGQAWNFAPPSAVPGYEQESTEAARRIIGGALPLMNPDGVQRSINAALAGDTSSIRETFAKALSIYQVAYWAGSTLLRRNYRLADDDCERLMPFNYQFAELSDPQSKLSRATQPTLEICNAIVRISGIDIESEFARIAAGN